MNKVCRVAAGEFLFAYVAALTLFVIGIFGLFGKERDPLSGGLSHPVGIAEDPDA